VDYHDYTLTINSKTIELDSEITIQQLKQRHGLYPGDEFVMVVLKGKVCLVKSDKPPGPGWFK
jgi:hypothetical protein